MMRDKAIFVTAMYVLLVTGGAYSAEPDRQKFRGVVTYHLIPPQVIRVNEIVEEPEPGTSYIGEKGILVELEKNLDVMANWTVVEVDYYEYPEPKVIEYDLFGDKHEVTVKYHAVSVDIDGDLSEYIPDDE